MATRGIILDPSLQDWAELAKGHRWTGLLWAMALVELFGSVVYWAMMAGSGEGFKDYFWGEEFDVTQTDIWGNVTRVLYLHGGLHLYRLPSGGTYKQHVGLSGNLLDQFGRVANRVPLFITEGSHTEKLRAIARSDYLSFALQEFARHNSSLVIFGHSLSKTDHHF